MDAIERIESAEAAFDKVIAANKRLAEALALYDETLGDLALFADYYSSDEWFDDHDADGRGELPVGLKRGVLSEDLPYDALIDTRDLALRMLEIATDILYTV